MLPLNSREVADAIQGELDAQPDCIPFKVSSVRADGRWFVVSLQKVSKRANTLDENFEGSDGWWPKPTKGSGRVLAVDVDENAVVLCDIDGPPPAVGEMLFLYPPRFLESLKIAWEEASWVTRINAWLTEALGRTQPSDSGVSLNAFPWLRQGQKVTESLPGWPISFVWGPPGTGKTRTLGALVAAIVTQFPKSRVLLASTTNSATDQAMVAIDAALEEIGGGKLTTERQSCKRIGTQFVAHNYERRKHLLPQRDEKLLRELMAHNRNRPEQGDLIAMAAWKEKDEELRKRLRSESIEIISRSRVSALTTTRASFDLESLRTLPPFDFLVIDEASQVSLAHALAMVPLAKHVIFAGDPQQLSPICQSESPGVEKWLGRSAFELRTKLPPGATGFLSEQSRMAGPICKYVSDRFYEGKLTVCRKAADNSSWRAERDVGCAEKDRLMVVPITRDGYYAQSLTGFVRHESAEKIRDLVVRLVNAGVKKDEIQVLTPFRAQRKVVRSLLKEAKCLLTASTVHRAQGTEKKIIIFDPVDGGGKFLCCEEGFRLINVACSRAQAQLIVMISSGDASNWALAPLATPALKLPLLCELASAAEFPELLIGKTFGYMGVPLRGKRILLNSLRVDKGGTEKSYNIPGMLEVCGNPQACPRGFEPHLKSQSRCCHASK